MGSTKAPSTSEPVSASPGSASMSQDKGKRLSTTGKFLHNIFSRLKSPFSPHSTTSPPAATASPSQQEKPLIEATPHSPENLDMAAAPTRHSIPGVKGPVTTCGILANGITGSVHVDKENQPSATEDPAPVTAMARFGFNDGPARPRSSTSIARETCTSGERAIHQGFMDQALDMVSQTGCQGNEKPLSRQH